jgi:tungstate transport system substrate-binding protein
MLHSRLRTLALLLSLCVPAAVHAEEGFITLASTTPPQDSGLFRQLLPAFTAKTGIEVRVLAVGTGRALDMGRRGNADVVFVHDRPAEEKFIAEGHGIARFDVMRDEFLLIGPKSDPANVRGLTDVLEAFRRIAAAKATFVSRRDRSGTNTAELRFWKAAGMDIGWIKGFWYKEITQGVLPALKATAEQDAYTLLDRGTWATFHDRRNLAVLVEGGKQLITEHAVVLVNPQKHPKVKESEARAFADWLLSPECQNDIASYRVNGEQIFTPTAIMGSYRLYGSQG